MMDGHFFFVKVEPSLVSENKTSMKMGYTGRETAAKDGQE